VNQPEDEKGNDFSEYGRARQQPPKERTQADGSGVGGFLLRGCGIAVGLALLLFLFVVGSCFLG
jgi:hypothetical protein